MMRVDLVDICLKTSKLYDKRCVADLTGVNIRKYMYFDKNRYRK